MIFKRRRAYFLFWNENSNTRHRWHEFLYHQLKIGRFSHRDKIDLNTTIDIIFERNKTYSYRLFSCLLVAFLVLLILDVKYGTVIYADKIKTSPYLSLRTHTYMLSDINHVERSCNILVHHKDYKYPKARLNYTLVMQDGRKVKIFNQDYMKPYNSPQVAALEKWNQRIEKDKLAPTRISSTHPDEIEPTQRNCSILIARTSMYRTYVSRLSQVFSLSR